MNAEMFVLAAALNRSVCLILDSIKYNGIEKTLEDLRSVSRNRREWNEEEYNGMLELINEVTTTNENRKSEDNGPTA